MAKCSYNPATEKWEGIETVPNTYGAVGASQPTCDTGAPLVDAQIEIDLWFEMDEGTCYVVAERRTPWCTIPGGSCGPPGTLHLTGASNPGGHAVTRARKAQNPWGPLTPWPGATLDDWRTHPGGATDPDFCHAPAEGYSTAIIVPCTQPVEGQSLMAAPVSGGGPEAEPKPAPEPPLPPNRRMARELARTGARVVKHAARTGRVRASKAERARRWEICRACDHYRPSDKRCGKLDGCGCKISAKIKLAASSCPLKPPKWGPEEVQGGSLEELAGHVEVQPEEGVREG